MLKIFFFILVIIIAMVAFYGYRFSRLIKVSEGVIASTIPYSLSDNSEGISLLVLGDSTAVGVGANIPEESIAGQLAKYIGATRVVNRGVSGAVVTDVYAQIAKSDKEEYDTILLQIGGNDMTRFHNLERVAKDYENIMKLLPKHKRLIVMSCGNLGGAKIFPSIIGRLYERVSRGYHTRFSEIVRRYGGIYIDIFDDRSVDPFIREPELYLAADLFHPSSVGYSYWFSKIKDQIAKEK